MIHRYAALFLVVAAGCSAGGTSSPDADESGGSGGAAGASSSVAGANAMAGHAGLATGGASAAGAAPAAGSAGQGGGSVGGSGGAGGGTVSACAGKAYKLCEDFESGAAAALPAGWTTFKGYGDGAPGDVGLSSEEFHSGKMALKSSSLATGQTRAQHSLSALGATASKHWGRIFYKVQSPPVKPTSGVFHVTFVGLMGSSENRVVDVVEDSQGMHQWLYNNPDDKGSLGSQYDWKFDAAWHCAEWYIDVGAKSYRFFTDSEEVESIGFTGKGDAQMSNYQAIIVGAEFYQKPPKAFVMWVDDLAIDDAQIGCQ